MQWLLSAYCSRTGNFIRAQHVPRWYWSPCYPCIGVLRVLKPQQLTPPVLQQDCAPLIISSQPHSAFVHSGTNLSLIRIRRSYATLEHG
jgi:hypothetical protein